jgi:hypothetical protein
MSAEIFLDAAYAIALASPNDSFHRRAGELADELAAAKRRLVTTRAILLEIGNALSKPRHREAAVRLLSAIEADPNIDVIPLSDPVYLEAVQLFRARPDKDWGLTDCVSFVVMQARGIGDALTTDEHFQQAGFRALMR